MSKLRQYLYRRVSAPSYRGVHIAQHNRLPENKLVALLDAINRASHGESFPVPPGDDPSPSRKHNPNQPPKVPGFSVYFRILDNIAELGDPEVTATFNSLKKNHFPNLAAMNLLSRTAFDRGDRGLREVKLTKSAHQILAAGPSRRRTELVGQAMAEIFGPQFLEDIFQLLGTLDVLNVFEFMLIVTDASINRLEKEHLVREYRQMQRMQQLQLHSELQEYCANTMDSPKVDQRDWHNWWNQSKQIVTMLATVSGFAVYRDEQVMLAGSAIAAVFSPKRSAAVVEEAFAWHGVPRKEDWDMHHIYPIEYATSEKDLKLIDAKENLLYIPRRLHQKIPTRANLFVKLSFKGSVLQLENPVTANPSAVFRFVHPEDVGCSLKNLPAMVAHNELILKSIG